MRNISIFAKRAFLNTNPSSAFEYKGKVPRNGHLQRVSSMIRGDQMADYLGAKFNPQQDYQDDVCIYVKPWVEKGGDMNLEGIPYIDIIDGHNLGQLALKHPEAGVIVCSRADQAVMSSVIPNKIVFIPQHHCNFERQLKTLGQITKVGIIGTKEAFKFLPQGLKKALSERGIDLVEYSKFFTRQDIINFYQNIDVQIVWRPYKKRLSNPLKIVNAASFGIPTIALDEEAFKEVSSCYIPVSTLGELLGELDALRSFQNIYFDFSAKCVVKAEEYHIENVSKLYRNLCTI